MLEQLHGERGANFDKDYDHMQLAGHKEAVALFENYAHNGDNVALKRWAAATLPHLQEHLAMAEKLSSRRFVFILCCFFYTSGSNATHAYSA
jgi:putative membrane protein